MAASLPVVQDKDPASDGLEFAENFSRFLILGGGLAGLAAAAHLVKNGVTDFKILEARKRLGGRIITVRIGEGQRFPVVSKTRTIYRTYKDRNLSITMSDSF